LDNIVRNLRKGLDPNAVAFRHLNGDVIHYGDFDLWIDQISNALKRSEIHGGHRVAVVMPRSPLGLALFLGVAFENICCPMSPRLKRDEIARIFETTQATSLLVSRDDRDAVEIASERGLSVICISQDASGRLQFESTIRSKQDPPSQKDDRYALLLQTSGTTSRPKVVLLKHSQILSTVHGIKAAFELGPRDTCLNPMPFQHAHGLVSAGLSSLVSGSTAVCLPSFSAAIFDAAFRKHRPTWFTGAPAMHVALLEYYGARGEKPIDPALRFFRSSSAPLPSSIIGSLESLFGAPLIETYGLTETATMIATNPLPPAVRKIGSVGIPCSGAEISIIMPDGQRAPAGVEGEILVRGPSVITHYGEHPAPDPDNFLNDWLRTGDVGYLDSDDYLFIVGRTKELIKRGGLSVYPVEIDNILMSLPGVAEAASFSIPHDTLGEDLVSAVVVNRGATFNEADLRMALFSRLSSYKVPSAIVAMEQIPKSDTGKIVRKEISRWFSSQLVPAKIAPDNDLERTLLENWAVVLGRTDIGVTDNLFLFGADPIRAERMPETALPPALRSQRGFWYRYPTVRRQAEMISRHLELQDVPDGILRD